MRAQHDPLVEFPLKSPMKFKLMFATALSALVVSVAGRAPAATVPAGVTLAAQQELTRDAQVEVESLDPAHIETVMGNTIGCDLFEGLTRVDAAGNVVPGVAQSWTRDAPDRWVFKLRHDARWSNGQPVTAADFIYSWQRLADPKTGSKYTILVEFVKNAKAIVAGKAAPATLGVRAPDPYTLEVTTETPVSFFPDIASKVDLAPVNRDTVAKFGDAWTRAGNMVSNGAYVLSDWQPNNHIVMLKNDKYWDARNVPITRVTYLPIESDETAQRMYQAGQFDVTMSIPSGVYPQLRKQFGSELKSASALGTYYYNLNNQDPALRDKRVRQALSMVIDRDLLTSRLLQSGELPTYGLVVKGTKGADPFIPGWASWPMQKRVEYARGLMKDAGYSDAKPLTLTLTYNTNEQHKKIALFIASEWRTKLGVSTKLENVENKVLLKMRHEGKTQVARNGWFIDYNDSTSFLDLVRCNSPQNDEEYCNPQVDALIEQGNQQTDEAKRTALLTQAHALAMNDYPVIPLYQYATNRLVKPYVGGYSLTNYIDQRVTQDMYIVKH
ncbi:Periplasmic oligopeptide-binding protein [Paraburkholderia humisilvae]|uniref:Periplasmic oligopeptide-binding protein n=2 Tax=Paraburkholderia humisilvae TaxID=627669 RepID=A0A6J5D5S6_9BURK|nr:Periplasmic oligopeptide-binding protein [Paraburkholderia humisilvae]